jgi:hypothetical protein
LRGLQGIKGGDDRVTILKDEPHIRMVGYSDETQVRNEEDFPSESLKSLQNIYQELYDEFVGCLKAEKFTGSDKESED